MVYTNHHPRARTRVRRRQGRDDAFRSAARESTNELPSVTYAHTHMRLFVSLNADDFRVLRAARLFHGVIGVYVEKPERASLRDLPFEL